jgi:hypothetical protein
MKGEYVVARDAEEMSMLHCLTLTSAVSGDTMGHELSDPGVNSDGDDFIGWIGFLYPRVRLHLPWPRCGEVFSTQHAHLSPFGISKTKQAARAEFALPIKTISQ